MNPAALSAVVKGDMANAVIASTPGGIEAQEKRGQLEQAELSTLPKNGTSGDKRAVWESLGFVFGADFDDIFVNVTFPLGWQKKATDHAYGTTLVDEKGRFRATIFYKAAFYDRRADVRLMPRYDYSGYLAVPGDNKHLLAGITDGEEIIIHRFGTTESGTDEGYHQREKFREEGLAWLQQNFPDYRNPMAYWD